MIKIMCAINIYCNAYFGGDEKYIRKELSIHVMLPTLPDSYIRVTCSAVYRAVVYHTGT